MVNKILRGGHFFVCACEDADTYMHDNDMAVVGLFPEGLELLCSLGFVCEASTRAAL